MKRQAGVSCSIHPRSLHGFKVKGDICGLLTCPLRFFVYTPSTYSSVADIRMQIHLRLLNWEGYF